MKRTRTFMTVAATVGFIVAGGAPAQARPLPTESVDIYLPGTNDAPDDGYCPFPVTIESFNAQRVTQTTLPNGATKYRFTGHAKAIVTNDVTGESITYNISGPGTQTVFPDGSFTIDAAGPNLLWTSVENSRPAGVLQLAYTTGRVRLAVDEDGQTTSYQLNGHTTDVCAELAP